MSKRLQIAFSSEAWAEVERVTEEANANFEMGSINYSDVICEMILSSKVDIKALQLKHTDIRRSLRAMASKSDLDIDQVINMLTEIRTKTKRKLKAAFQSEEPANA